MEAEVADLGVEALLSKDAVEGAAEGVDRSLRRAAPDEDSLPGIGHVAGDGLRDGGMITGIGSGLTEEAVVDPRHRHFVNAALAEYHLPVHADVGEVEVLFVPKTDALASSLGIKGLGEVGIVGVAAAIANAVFNTTGVRVREAAVTLDKILGGLSDRRRG